MDGLTQRFYQHRIPCMHTCKEPRINITWRYIVKHSSSCKQPLLVQRMRDSRSPSPTSRKLRPCPDAVTELSD